MSLDTIIAEIREERSRQDAKWGEQNYVNGTGSTADKGQAEVARAQCDRAFRENRGTWLYILQEEVAEAFAEADPAKLRAELLQCAAVCVAWVEAIDRKVAKENP